MPSQIRTTTPQEVPSCEYVNHPYAARHLVSWSKVIDGRVVIQQGEAFPEQATQSFFKVDTPFTIPTGARITRIIIRSRVRGTEPVDVGKVAGLYLYYGVHRETMEEIGCGW